MSSSSLTVHSGGRAPRSPHSLSFPAAGVACRGSGGGDLEPRTTTRSPQESLGGRAKTCVIATLSPGAAAADVSLSTLDYAARARSIKNAPEANARVARKHVMKEYGAEIEGLRAALAAARDKNGTYLPPGKLEELEVRHDVSRADLVSSQLNGNCQI